MLTMTKVECLEISTDHCIELTKLQDAQNSSLKHLYNGDTLTQDDVVRKQYRSLPYPEISEDEIVKTYNHYKGELRHIPYMRIVAQELESLNHFLYKGKSNFKYAK